jgi:hypothetical protein
MYDGEKGEFITFLIWDEVTVKWTWCAGDDWEVDGYFDIFVYKDGLDVTYDIPKRHFQWIEAQVKEYAGYEPPSAARVKYVMNGLANNIF